MQKDKHACHCSKYLVSFFHDIVVERNDIENDLKGIKIRNLRSYLVNNSSFVGRNQLGTIMNQGQMMLKACRTFQYKLRFDLSPHLASY